MFMAPTEPNEIIKHIDSLKRKKGSGHDNIPSTLIKDVKNEIALPLTILFNKSLNTGSVPDLMKLAKVIPIYKAKEKLEWYGVPGVALEWFKSYLERRKQYVQYKSSKSSTEIIPCGVPQGSVLGPLLFIIYTNDLPNCLNYSKAIQFADDTMVFLSSADILYLYITVNHDLEYLVE